MKKSIFVLVILAVVIIFGWYWSGSRNVEPVAFNIETAQILAAGTECTEKGALGEGGFYNENSKTWWLDLAMKEEFKKDGCNPACVVSEETKTAEINWRCTGLAPTN